MRVCFNKRVCERVAGCCGAGAVVHITYNSNLRVLPKRILSALSAQIQQSNPCAMPALGRGRRQLAAAAAAAAPAEPERHSALLELLIGHWSWGLVSAPFVQKCCAAAVADGIRHPHVQRFATCGSGINNEVNVHRDFMRVLCKPDMYNAIATIQLPMKHNVRSVGWDWEETHVMLPHLLFATLYEKYNESFEARLVGDFNRIRKFWEELESVGCPRYAAHPVRCRDNHKDFAIPIKLHGDGVPVVGVSRAWCKSANVLEWSGLLAPGSTIDTLWPIYILYPLLAVALAAANTKEMLYKEVLWSLHWLWLGEYPTTDSSGRPMRRTKRWLAGGYYCVLWKILSDMDWRVSELGMEDYRSNNPCVFCGVNCSDIPWTDFRIAGAAYIATVWTSDALWMAARPNRHWLFRLVGVGISALAADWMHDKHLGTDKYFYGSVLDLLCYHYLPGTPEENLDAINALIKAYNTSQGLSDVFQNICLNMFHHGDDFPQLKGKAAECRMLGPGLLHAFTSLVHRPEPLHMSYVRLALSCSCFMEQVISVTSDHFTMPQNVYTGFANAGFNFLHYVTLLRNHYRRQVPHVCLFNVTIKFHDLVHAIRQAQYLHPHLTWCYAGETYMAKAKALIQSCSRGTRPGIVSKKFFKKLSMGMHIRLVQQGRWMSGR